MKVNSGDDHQSAMQGEIFVVILVAVLILAVSERRSLLTTVPETNPSTTEPSLPKKAELITPSPIPAKTLDPAFPLMIRLTDKEREMTFDSTSWRLTAEAAEHLRLRSVPDLERSAEVYHCNVVEVYGYTDGQSMLGRRQSTNIPKLDFDAAVYRMLHGIVPEQIAASTIQPLPPPTPSVDAMIPPAPDPPPFSPGSNIELGMLRAAYVANILYQEQAAGHLPSILQIRILSGGSFTLPDGTQAAPGPDGNRSRRRVDLRLSNLREFEVGK